MADITVDVSLPSALSVDVTSPTQALATNVSIPGPQGPRGEKGNPTSINNLTAENIIITGADGNIVSTSGDSTIFISGNSGYFQSAVNSLTTNLNSTGANLNTKIDTFSGTYQSFVNNLDTTYATDTQLQNTGSTLNTKIDNLSGYVNSQDLSISNNLASTGSSLQVSINSVSSNLISTGTNLDIKINSLSGTLTGNYLTTSSASNTYATITNLSNTGSNLNTKIDNFSGTYQNFVDNLDVTYATDNQLQNTGSTLNQSISSLSGTLTNNYYLKSNPSGFITGIDLSSYITSSTVSSTYATIANLQNTGSNLQTQINNLNDTYATDTDITNLNNKITSLSGDAVLEYGNQTIQGAKTFTEDLVVQKSGFFWSGIKIGLNSIIISDESIKIAGDPVIVQSAFTGYTGDVVNTYATITNLGLTGSTLQTSIDNLGTTYATVSNLALTGSTLQTSINNLGTTYATVSNLALTGSTLQTSINNLGTTYATVSNLASTGETLQSNINSLSGSSVLLYGDQTIDGTKTFRDKVYIHDLYVTGTEFVANVQNNFIESQYILLNLTGGATDGGIFFVTGSGLTGINDLGPIIGFDHTDKFKFGISSRGADLSTLNDIAAVQDITAYSGFVDGKYATIINLASTGSTLQNQIDNLGNTYATVTNLASTGSTLDSKIGSLSGTLTSTYATITNLGLTGSTLQTQIDNLGATYATVTNLTSTGSTLNTKIDNLSGYVNSSSSNIVFTTGDQTINGLKTFTSGIDIYSGTNPQSIRVFNRTGTNSGEFGLFGWQNNNLIIGSQATNSGILRDITITGNNINLIASGGKGLIFIPQAASEAYRAGGILFSNPDATNQKAGIVGFNGEMWFYGYGTQVFMVSNSRGTNNAPTVQLTKDGVFSWSPAGFAQYSDLSLGRAAAGVLMQQNGTNPQQYRIFNSTGTNSGEFGLFGWQNNNLIIGSQATNSGIRRDVILTGNRVISTVPLIISGADLSGINTNGTQGFRLTSRTLQLLGDNLDTVISNAGYTSTIQLGQSTNAYVHNGSNNNTFAIKDGYSIGFWGSSISNIAATPEVRLWRDGSGVLALRTDNISLANYSNGATRSGPVASGFQFRIYNITGTNTGEFGLLGWQNNQLIIGAQQSQSGILRDVIITGNNININGSGAFNIFDNTNISGNLNVTGNTAFTSRPTVNGTGVLLSGEAASLPTTIVYTTGNQTIGGNKTFTGVTTFSGQEINLVDTALNLSGVGDMTFSGTNINFINSPVYISGTNLRVSGDVFANNLVYNTSNQIISGVKTFIGNHIISGDTTITGNLNVSGRIVSPQQNKTFVYRPTVTGGGNSITTIAYGANCTLTPKYVGTLRADACISVWGLNGASTDTPQAASFWYGTGTAPVYSGNLVNLGGTRIGGLKHPPAPGNTNAINVPYPVGTSWVAELTGLNTGTQYWFDIGISGSFGRLRVQDVQLYIEEKY